MTRKINFDHLRAIFCWTNGTLKRNYYIDPINKDIVIEDIIDIKKNAPENFVSAKGIYKLKFERNYQGTYFFLSQYFAPLAQFPDPKRRVVLGTQPTVSTVAYVMEIVQRFQKLSKNHREIEALKDILLKEFVYMPARIKN